MNLGYGRLDMFCNYPSERVSIERAQRTRRYDGSWRYNRSRRTGVRYGLGSVITRLAVRTIMRSKDN